MSSKADIKKTKKNNTCSGKTISSLKLLIETSTQDKLNGIDRNI